MLPITFNLRLFLLLSAGFIISVFVGTLSHEGGHYFMARVLGYENASIHYSYTQMGILPDAEQLYRQWNDANALEQQRQLALLSARIKHDELLFVAGGPLQTMLTGTVGLLFLFLFAKNIREPAVPRFRHWLLIFLTLFWMRQPLNLMTGSAMRFLTGKWGRGDERFLSLAFGWPPEAIYLITGAAGVIVLGLTIFKFIPAAHRFTFLLSGIAGGGSGYILWLYIIGPKLMP